MSQFDDPARIDALDELGRRFEAAINEPRCRRWRPPTAAIVIAALVAAPAIAAVPVVFDFGWHGPRPGQPGGPPPVVRDPAGKPMLQILSLPLHRPEQRRALRHRLDRYGIELKVQRRPAPPADIGRILDVQFPPNARFDRAGRLLLERGLRGPIVVAIGRAPRRGEHVKQHLYDALPQVERAVDVNDPDATGRRLAGLGFHVRWMLVVDNPRRGEPGERPTGSAEVTGPPPDTHILSVLNQDGENVATPETRDLLIEVTPAGSDIESTHSG